jgi:hypothetical protein
MIAMMNRERDFIDQLLHMLGFSAASKIIAFIIGPKPPYSEPQAWKKRKRPVRLRIPWH